eukprot:TRINITY_DN7221_c0_g1_i1.p1 TRINITY_DN7221_c0_g1~~TRINITY_DN7221_c0_g1_i1.p1  ORF type:complete len:230 (-),score=95.26 TRINITY_DN7221_c0_g1_i1:50-739(-)
MSSPPSKLSLASSASSLAAEMFKQDQPYTFFLPESSALASLPADFLRSLLSNTTNTTNATNATNSHSSLADRFIKCHIVNGTWYTAGLFPELPLTSLSLSPLNISMEGKSYKISSSLITQPDLSVTNGVIHFISTPLDCDNLFTPTTTTPVNTNTSPTTRNTNPATTTTKNTNPTPTPTATRTTVPNTSSSTSTLLTTPLPTTQKNMAVEIGSFSLLLLASFFFFTFFM